MATSTSLLSDALLLFVYTRLASQVEQKETGGIYQISNGSNQSDAIGDFWNSGQPSGMLSIAYGCYWWLLNEIMLICDHGMLMHE